ncbi:hypothetical protein N5J77_14375 [Sphingobium yanoikuyae]|uniref:Uncharacterized protein n=1 Tax=Sphingobium yanoikuyae TaxID=13690 RepID=A0AA43BBJ2_SPHYA|nr:MULTISPECIES: hypothetical protein [Sphingobium]MDH2132315.1 hypothetical protein [Sphingobium yanoikuyae]MDH2150090.1 hypothetical protein [Sphingobium yanoikuyae]MDH2168782.1 hypothetical protein [Sphingobium yanoikuyae]
MQARAIQAVISQPIVDCLYPERKRWPARSADASEFGTQRGKTIGVRPI